MISSHEPTAPEVDALRAQLADVKAALDAAEAEVMNLSHDYDRRGERLWRMAAKAGWTPHEADNDATAELWIADALDRAVLLKAALVGDITDLRDLMARRANEDYDAASGWPALVTAHGVAAALTTILNQEQS